MSLKKKDDGLMGALVKRTVVGFIPLPLATARGITSNDIPASTTTPAGGLLTSSTNPALARVNGATDKSLRLVWAASNAVEVQFQTVSPLDLDDSQPIRVKLLASMGGTTDTATTISVGFFEGVGDTNAGTTTGTLTNTTSIVTVSVAAGDIAAAPKQWSVLLTPGTHANDALRVEAAWIEYTRKP